MELLQIIILSIVEGVTEFLPISSTGHLILTSKLLNLTQTEFLKTFEISIQLGAILAVIFLFWRELLADKNSLKRVIWVFLPTGILGFILYRVIKSYLIGDFLITILALFLGGIFIIFFEKLVLKKEGKLKINQLSLKQSLILGVIQVLSVIPGVSRSATTIFGGLILGLSRTEATKLSFLVAVPVMAGATGLDLIQSFELITKSNLLDLGLGIILSFITATGAIKWLLKYLETNSFLYFGVYRIVLALLFLILIY